MRHLTTLVALLIAAPAHAQSEDCTRLIEAKFQTIKRGAIKSLPEELRGQLAGASWAFVDQPGSYARVKFGAVVAGETDIIEISPRTCDVHDVEKNAVIAHEFGHLVSEIKTPDLYTAAGRGARTYQDYENIANTESRAIHKAARLDLSRYVELATIRCDNTNLPYWCLQQSVLASK